LIVAAFLATGTWIVIGNTMYSQLESSHKFASEIVPKNAIATPLKQEKISNIKDAQDMVDRTSSSIYALLTPIATAMTGYFFASTVPKKIEGEPKNLPDSPDPKDPPPE
jgi:predicted negative regulator of RcsB-dependent stress response